MYLTDYHTHSLCSPDGKCPLTAMAQAAVDAGLAELCVTDHWDLVREMGDGLILDYDWTGVLEQVAQARAAFDEHTLKIRMGMELGSGQRSPEHADAVLAKVDVDFVIGSLHNMTAENGGRDFFFVEYTAPEVCYAALDDYFTSMEQLAPLDCYDVLGHIIYPLRYFPEAFHISLDDYWERLEPILKTVVAHGKGIEVNTYRGKTLSEWKPVLELYRACGGELVTTGSDAHVTSSVGKGIPEAMELLRSCGFRYVTTYERRQPQQHKL